MNISEICPMCKEEPVDTNCGVAGLWKPHSSGGETPADLFFCAPCWDKAMTHSTLVHSIRKLHTLLDPEQDDDFGKTCEDPDVKELLRSKIIPQWIWNLEP